MKAKLFITEPTGNTREINLSEVRRYTIGRAKENDIILNDRRVSRKHAFIEVSPESCVMIDGFYENDELFRSVNHLYVNDDLKLEAELADGDLITIGETRIVFSLYFETVTEVADIGITGRIMANDTLRTESQVAFDDSPLGHTQVQMSVNEILVGGSDLSLESAVITPVEIKDLRRKAKMLELLLEMSKTLGTVFELEDIFQKATDLIFRGTPADRVVALLTKEPKKGETNQRILYQVGVKTRDESLTKLTEKLPVSRTITRRVMSERVAILSQDAKTDEQFQGAESIVAQGVRSTICAPLITQTDVHGVIYADRLDQFSTFSQAHLELISSIAALTAITVETVKAHKRLAREEVARANYSRFMPEYVVKQLLENPDSFRLGGVNQTITVMFADIRGFTSISENENPERIVGLLNHYFSAMSEIIFEHGGTLDKYIGDGLMALFGAPTATPNDAGNALRTAVAMQRRLKTLKDELDEQGFSKISVGIGLHTGIATVGYIGSERRSEYTAIGDTVNLASRLESNTVGGQILISDATAEAAGDIFPLVRCEPLTVKNRVRPVDVFDVKWE